MFLVASIVSPDWIEKVSGMAPDDGDGGAEWGVALAAAAVFFAMAWLARRDWRAFTQRDRAVAVKGPG